VTFFALLHSFWGLLRLGIWVPIAVGYALGSIPFGYLIAKLGHGRDIRQSGSGNIGAANVTRTLGKAAGLLTLLLDAAKGFLAVWLMRFVEVGPDAQIFAGLAAIAGHFFPVWLRFKGGKGVATGLGAFLCICWQAVAGTLLVWVVTVAAFRYVSLGSMVAAASLPILIFFLYWPGEVPPSVVTVGAGIAGIAIILKHHENIARLAAGNERKLKL